jgi:hypothetical protein
VLHHLLNFEAQFNGFVTSITFCGNLSDRFVLGEFTSVDYTSTPGLQARLSKLSWYFG